MPDKPGRRPYIGSRDGIHSLRFSCAIRRVHRLRPDRIIRRWYRANGRVRHFQRPVCNVRFGPRAAGLLPKANYNIGLGHTFGFLKKDPFGDEITFGYTYENAGSHGFLHTDFGSHTEALGLMKNFAIPGTKRVTGYTWIQSGISSMTGNAFVQNRFYDGESLGAIVHFNDRHSIWIQETYNKIASIPWYTTASIGYTRSW